MNENIPDSKTTSVLLVVVGGLIALLFGGFSIFIIGLNTEYSDWSWPSWLVVACGGLGVALGFFLIGVGMIKNA